MARSPATISPASSPPDDDASVNRRRASPRVAEPLDAAATPSEAFDLLQSGLNWARQANRDNDPAKWQRAIALFESSLEAEGGNSNAALRHRTVINLAAALIGLGKIDKAFGWLKDFDDAPNDTKFGLRSYDDARAYYTLGAAYLEARRFWEAAGKCETAVSILRGAPKRRREDHADLLAAALSKWATALIEGDDAEDTNRTFPKLNPRSRAEQAVMCADEALLLLSRDNDPVNFAHTEQIFGDALSFRSDVLKNAGEREIARSVLKQAITKYNDACLLFQDADAKIDWIRAVTSQADAKCRLASQLWELRTEDGRSISLLRAAANHYLEVLSENLDDQAHSLFRRHLGLILKSLESHSTDQQDFLFVRRITWYATILTVERGTQQGDLYKALPAIFRGLNEFLMEFGLLLHVTETDRKILALAAYLSSLDLGRDETRHVIVGAFRKAGLADLLAQSDLSTTDQAPASKAVPSETALPDEMVRRRTGHTTGAETSKGLPPLPAGLEWPTETYSTSPEAKRGGGGIVPYLERVWLPLISDGLVDLRTLRARDSTAAMAVNNFKRGGHSLPEHIDIPTRKEMNDRLLGAGVVPVKDANRLASAAYRRAKRPDL